jgi:hypothetical protein
MPSEFSRDSRPLPDGQVTAQPEPSCEHLPRVPNPPPCATGALKITSHHTSCTSAGTFRRDEYAALMARHPGRRRQPLPRPVQLRPERSEQERSEVDESLAQLPSPTAGERRRASASCGWCRQPIEAKARGRLPKWCSASCRQRAWEQARAAASGLSAVRVVELPLEVRVPATPTRQAWARLLLELAHQLDDGRVYNRDLRDLGAALKVVQLAYERRPFVRDRAAAGRPI